MTDRTQSCQRRRLIDSAGNRHTVEKASVAKLNPAASVPHSDMCVTVGWTKRQVEAAARRVRDGSTTQVAIARGQIPIIKVN